MKIAILGLGEAGSRFANDLAELGFQVSGWDPNLVKTLHQKIHFAKSNADAVAGCEVVFNVNLSAVAKEVAQEVKNFVAPQTLFCEMNTSSPKDKIEIENILSGYCKVVDVGIMGPVPAKGIRTPFLVSGNKAKAFQSLFPTLENITAVEGPVGKAAELKLLRSIVYKGVAGVICEAMEAAVHFNQIDYMKKQIESIIGPNENLIDRFIEGSKLHAKRRSNEMKAVSSMLSNEGLDAFMSEAALQKLIRHSKANQNNQT